MSEIGHWSEHDTSICSCVWCRGYREECRHLRWMIVKMIAAGTVAAAILLWAFVSH